jgi:subtilisin family serine protease
VAVIDTGVDASHPFLAGRLLPGVSFVEDQDEDISGHGTHVSGIIGATGDNGEGVIGVNWDVTLIPLKIWDGGGNGSEAELIAALAYAECLEIPILNISGGWYGSGNFQSMRDAIDAYSGLIVAAAGNGSNDNDDPYEAFYPAAFGCANIIAVAASGREDELTSFSGYGAASVDLAAPGSDILSTVDYWLWDYEEDWYTAPGYEAWAGTSMAAAHVAGAAALLQAAEPNLSAAEIKAAIINTVDHSAALNGLVLSNGRLNVYGALDSLAGGSGRYSLVFYESNEPGNYYHDNNYIVDINSTNTAYVCARVIADLENTVGAPQLASIVYESDSGVINTTGEFTLDELEIAPFIYESNETYVTATATLSDGTILQESAIVEAIAINPRR